MRRILFTFALAVALLFGYAVPASAAPSITSIRCVVKYDSHGKRVVLCILPPILRTPTRYV